MELSKKTDTNVVIKKDVKFFGKANGRAISPNEIINEVKGL